MDVILEDTREQVTHKIQDKRGIKPRNVNLYIVDSLRNCGKTVNQLKEENDELFDNNDISMSHINFLYKEAK